MIQTPPKRAIIAAIALLAAALSTGCVQRRMLITSTPPGATVYLNDVEIGRTPVEAVFKYYGKYDVRLDLDGYEPISEGRTAHAPLWQYPGVDLAAAAVPMNLEDVVAWHFDLVPSPDYATSENEVVGDLGGRARDLRDRLHAEPID